MFVSLGMQGYITYIRTYVGACIPVYTTCAATPSPTGGSSPQSSQTLDVVGTEKPTEHKTNRVTCSECFIIFDHPYEVAISFLVS